MEDLSRSFNLEQAFQTEPNFDKYARKILENSKTITTATATATTISPPAKIRDFLQEFGATFINSIQLQNFQKTLHTNHRFSSNGTAIATTAATATATANDSLAAFNSSSIVSATINSFNNNYNHTNEMEIEFIPNHIIIDSSSFDTMDELQKQLQYDKFMNEVWIGIVMTLILISMIFCVCSCFLYHQFRTWKRNYHSTVVQVNSAADIESLKIDSDHDDPVPEYTLVSGLPSYEAALELMQKTPQAKSCLIVYPSVFNVFNKNERSTGQMTIVANTINNNNNNNQQQNVDITTPLLSNSSTTPTPTPATATTTAPAMMPTTTATSTPSAACSKTNDESNVIMESSAQSINEKELLEFLNEQSAAAAATATATATAINIGTKSSALEEVKVIKSNDKRK